MPQVAGGEGEPVAEADAGLEGVGAVDRAPQVAEPGEHFPCPKGALKIQGQAGSPEKPGQVPPPGEEISSQPQLKGSDGRQEEAPLAEPSLYGRSSGTRTTQEVDD